MTKDRTGDDVDDDAHPPRCPGWLGFDSDYRPIPCLRCKPHLARGRPQ